MDAKPKPLSPCHDVHHAWAGCHKQLMFPSLLWVLCCVGGSRGEAYPKAQPSEPVLASKRLGQRVISDSSRADYPKENLRPGGKRGMEPAIAAHHFCDGNLQEGFAILHLAQDTAAEGCVCVLAM